MRTEYLALIATLAMGCNLILGINDHALATDAGSTARTGGSAYQASASSIGGATTTSAGGTTTVRSSTPLLTGGSEGNGGSATSNVGGTATVSTTLAAGGSSSLPGTSAGGASASTGGTTATSSSTAVECLSTDAPKCTNNAPTTCVNGTWVARASCSGDKPACSQGGCSAAILTGGIVTVGTPVLTNTSGVRLVEHGLEYTPTVCGNVPSLNKAVCVSGGIRP